MERAKTMISDIIAMQLRTIPFMPLKMPLIIAVGYGRHPTVSKYFGDDRSRSYLGYQLIGPHQAIGPLLTAQPITLAVDHYLTTIVRER